MLKRRFTTIAAATVAVMMLTSSAAFAHFCFNANRSANGTQGAAGSPAWLSLGELVETVLAPELCDDGVDHVVATVDPDGEFATHAVVTLASGQNRNQPQLSGDDQGIDHIFPGHPELVAAVGAAIGEGFALCAAA